MCSNQQNGGFKVLNLVIFHNQSATESLYMSKTFHRIIASVMPGYCTVFNETYISHKVIHIWWYSLGYMRFQYTIFATPSCQLVDSVLAIIVFIFFKRSLSLHFILLISIGKFWYLTIVLTTYLLPHIPSNPVEH